MRKMVLLAAMLAMVLAAAAPALGESYSVPLDNGFVSTFDEGAFEGNTAFVDDSYASTFEFGNFESADVGSGSGFDDPFASSAQFNDQEVSVVGGGGYILFAGDFGTDIIDIGELEGSGEGGASDDQYE